MADENDNRVPDVEIKLELAGAVNPDTVAHSTQDLIRALRNIESNITREAPKVQWRWRDDAAVWAIATPNGVDATTLRKICNEARLGLQRVKEAEGKEIDWPQSFGKPAQVSVKHLVRQLAKEPKDAGTIKTVGKPEAIRFYIDGQQPLFIEHVVVREEYGHKKRPAEPTSVDGVLDLISVRGGLRFEITEHGTKRKIACLIDSDTLLKQATKALGRRVVVDGMLEYKIGGAPKQVSQIKAIWARPKAIPMKSFRGSLPKLTGGLSAEEYVRKIRSRTRGDASE
jgi:hypothetical protein